MHTNVNNKDPSPTRDHSPSPKTLPPMMPMNQQEQLNTNSPPQRNIVNDNQQRTQLPSLHSLHMMHPQHNEYHQQNLRHAFDNVSYHLMSQAATATHPNTASSCTNPQVSNNTTESSCSKKRKINKMACVNCSKLHKKCDGESPVPCTRCAAKGLDCVYMERRKRGPKTKRTKCGGGFEEDDYDCTEPNTPGPTDYHSQRTPSMPEKFSFPSSSCHSGTNMLPTFHSFGSNPFSLISSMLGANKTSNQLPPYKNMCQTQFNSTNDEISASNTSSEINSTIQGPTAECSPRQSEIQQQQQPLIANTPIKTLNQSSSEYRTFKLLICVTGSVAAIKVPELISMFLKSEISNSSVPMRFDVRVAFTNSALHFCPLDKLKDSVIEFMTPELSNTTKVENQELPILNYQTYTDQDEWNMWNKRGDPVTHVDLKKWADVLLVAPLDANSLAKIANGLCDNLVTCVCRAWELHKPFIVCPAMNTSMWTHPFTKKHLDILNRELGVVVIEPVSKTLMCGDSGVGAMASVDSIYMGCKQVLQARSAPPK
jgi:phosphopantothenoylcysteine decarboxylase